MTGTGGAARTGASARGAGRPTARPARLPRVAHLRHETAWLAEPGVAPRTIAGMDEVGRGALAGPVSVGVVVVDVTTRRPPRGLTDSKLLTRAAREDLAPRVRRWGLASAVGHAGDDEVDAFGILAALRIAGRRALAQVAAAGVPVDAVLLDGSHDWLTEPAADLLDLLGPTAGAPARPLWPADAPAPRLPAGVRTLVKGDVQCASVAGASVLAKCERDDLMRALALEEPRYGWESNKGYASAAHVRALAEHGPSARHRTSWRLPGLAADGVARAGVHDAPTDDGP